MATRRTFLKSSGAAAALLGTMGLAGCSEVEDAVGGGDGGGGTEYSGWLYDPSEVMDTSYEMFGTFSIEDIYANEEHIPDEVFENLEDANDDLSEVGVDLEETSSMTMMGFLEEDFEPASANLTDGGGSAAVSGSFEVDEMEDRVEENNETLPEEQQLEEEDEYEGYSIWVSEYEQEMMNGETRNQSSAIGLSEDNIVSGAMASNDAEAIEAVEEMIDANNGDADTWTDVSDDGDEVISQLGSNTMAMGSLTPDIDTYVGELTGAMEQSEDESSREFAELLDEIADNMVAMGMAMEILGEEYETRFAMVYDESDDAEVEPYEDMIDLIKEENESEVEQPLENVEVSKNGRTIMVTTSGETETLFENAEDSASGSASGSAGASGTAEAGAGSGEDESGGGDGDYSIDLGPNPGSMQFVTPSDVFGTALTEGGLEIGR